ncbi:hypothetical protein [Streptomyces misionensis]|uniref:hypothetical protein n=1 Tax=Streptomyces misionensis TaxID=67331 RepID=UPI0036853FD4
MDVSAHGIFDVVIPATGVNKDVRPFVSICELDSNNRSFRGAANMSIANVIPLDEQQIYVTANVAWGANLKVRLNWWWI